MDRFIVSCSHSKTYHLGRRHALWLSTVLLCGSLNCASAENTSARGHERTIQHSGDSSPGVRKREDNSTGTLSVQDDSLQFQQMEAWR